MPSLSKERTSNAPIDITVEEEVMKSLDATKGADAKLWLDKRKLVKEILDKDIVVEKKLDKDLHLERGDPS